MASSRKIKKQEEEWRFLRFSELGFSEDEAKELAKNSQASYNEVGKALENGCTKELALQIYL